MKNNKEQRRFPREQANTDAAIYILAPEETFSPYPLSGKIKDISIKGLGVVIPSLPREMFIKLLAGRRLTRVVARLPGNDSKSRIFGTIVWIDYHNERPGAPCGLGISLEQVEEKTRQELEQSMAFLKRKSSVAGNVVDKNEATGDIRLAAVGSNSNSV